MVMNVVRTNDGSETYVKNSRGIVVLKEAEIKYTVFNPDSKRAAIQAVANAAPAKFGSLFFYQVRFDSFFGDSQIELTAEYSQTEPENQDEETAEEPVMSFSASSDTMHVSYAISQSRVYPRAKPNDAGGAIGWNGKTGDESQIDGVDIPIGQMHETYVQIVPKSYVTTAYKRTLNRLIGKVNSTAFKGWQPGEVMYKGASFSTPIKGKNKVSITHEFDIRENESNATVAGLQIGEKKGFEYLCARSTSENDRTTNTPKIVVEAVYKNVVTHTADFSSIGIGL